MILPILIEPDARLHKACRPLTEISDETDKLLDDMYETMVAGDGIGIAAPQLGKNIQVAIVALEDIQRFEMINPEIIASSGSNIDVEGCLSIPGRFGTVERAEEITVRFFDRDGEEVEVDASGYLARAFQHEIDHLHGILFTEKIIEEIPEDQLEAYWEEHDHD